MTDSPGAAVPSCRPPGPPGAGLRERPARARGGARPRPPVRAQSRRRRPGGSRAETGAAVGSRGHRQGGKIRGAGAGAQNPPGGPGGARARGRGPSGAGATTERPRGAHAGAAVAAGAAGASGRGIVGIGPEARGRRRAGVNTGGGMRRRSSSGTRGRCRSSRRAPRNSTRRLTAKTLPAGPGHQRARTPPRELGWVTRYTVPHDEHVTFTRPYSHASEPFFPLLVQVCLAEYEYSERPRLWVGVFGDLLSHGQPR